MPSTPDDRALDEEPWPYETQEDYFRAKEDWGENLTGNEIDPRFPSWPVVTRDDRTRTSGGDARVPERTPAARETLDTPLLDALEARADGGGRRVLTLADAELDALPRQIQRVRDQLGTLPLHELDKLDDLDTQRHTLTAQREQLRAQLHRTPAAIEAAGSTDGAGQHPRLTSALDGIDRQLERIASEQTATAAGLGGARANLALSRAELTQALHILTRRHEQLARELAQLEVAAQPQWLTDALGPRPDDRVGTAQWDRAAREITSYRLQQDIADREPGLPATPAAAAQQATPEQARRARDRYTHSLNCPGADIDR